MLGDILRVGAPIEAPAPEEAAPLGALIYDDGAEAERLLAECAHLLAQSGSWLGGVVQANTPRPGRRRCDMSLTDLLSGEELPISLDLGDEAAGCRLDPEAFARAGQSLERAIAAGVDLLIVNKFGKLEAQGRGLRPQIAEALLAGIPVLLGVSRLNLDAFLAFAGDGFARIGPDQGAIQSWCAQVVRGRRSEAC